MFDGEVMFPSKNQKGKYGAGKTVWLHILQFTVPAVAPADQLQVWREGRGEGHVARL